MSSNTALPKGHAVSNDNITLCEYFTPYNIRTEAYLIFEPENWSIFILTIRSNRLGFLK